VSAGDPVVTLEAMKLMHQLTAPIAGTVTAIHYQAGDTVSGAVCIVTIEPHEEQNT
jgi:biotin carboxyl carrier protein